MIKARFINAVTFIAVNFFVLPTLAEELFILSPSGRFLGLVGKNGSFCSKYDSECIWNTYSDHGSNYGRQSIFNNYGDYGSDYGRQSICNPNISYKETPALYIKDGNLIEFYDLIGPDSKTKIGYTLYTSACSR